MTYPARQFVALASILAAGVEGLGARGPGVAKAAGRRFDEAATLPGGRTVADALSPLSILGAEYTDDGDQITAGNGICLEACNDAREVICEVRSGILEDALHSAGIDVSAQPRGPTPADGCAYALRRSRSRT